MSVDARLYGIQEIDTMPLKQSLDKCFMFLTFKSEMNYEGFNSENIYVLHLVLKQKSKKTDVSRQVKIEFA